MRFGSCTLAQGVTNGNACLQGVICFESTMAAGEAAGIVQNGRPVLCKPSAVVSRLMTIGHLHQVAIL